MKKKTVLIIALAVAVIIVAAVMGVSYYNRSFPAGEDAYNGISVYFKEGTPVSEEVAILDRFDADRFDDELPHYYVLSFPGKTVQYVEEQLQILLAYEQVDKMYTATSGVGKRIYDQPDYGENGKVRGDN